MATLQRITFRAPADAIERARHRARLEGTTLQEKFRQWLDGYAARRPTREERERLMQRLSYVNAGRKFTREEMNER